LIAASIPDFFRIALIPARASFESGLRADMYLAGAFGVLVAKRLEDPASSGLLFHDGDGGSLLGCETKLGLSERAMLAWRTAAPSGFEFYSLRGCCSSRAEQGGATDVQVSALLSYSRGQNSTYSLASSVGLAMACAERQAQVEIKNPGGLIGLPSLKAEASH
jgi:hypothetical protein